ncbi:UdgX family uracil-DNA binding protein [Citreimonas salinaria]|uniref:Type-4 uracil-DNA glycosylase n=1 Tax=Citreimonas salinaria TaxID=321339 RepID=A0A1H3H6P9_9RHOB|nr:UdgX family uracil-DNA binding protein [Citreimonas salinaria]SDY11192.1 DNA polymerase [Citreimonas salinaria]
MFAPRLPRIGTESAWRDAARRLASKGVPPEAVDWGLEGDAAAMFDDPLPATGTAFTVARGFVDLARVLIPERSGQGMAVAYALLVRLRDDPRLLDRRADPLVARADRIAKDVRRDLHKMHAFVRFREVGDQSVRRRFAAWFEPAHRIEEPVADFFVNRFGDMDWIIATPEVTLIYHGSALRMEAKASTRLDEGDPIEALWTTYYSNIFNPARLKVDAMKAEMPVRYWRNLPEARVIPQLIAGARAKVTAMHEAGFSTPPPQFDRRRMTMPENLDATPLDALAREAAGCTRCPLYCDATQTIFGEGPEDARVMVVGEQPGDQEDLAGRPFVGPAGRLFDEQAKAAGLVRKGVYVTNAVKHFKFVQRGKRRIHQRPDAGEVTACRWWLDREIATVKPDLIVAMGATALQALTGSGKGILKRRGGVESGPDDMRVLATVHPSYLLRLPDREARARETDLFRADLARARDLVDEAR